MYLELGSSDPTQLYSIYSDPTSLKNYFNTSAKNLIFHDQEPIMFSSFNKSWMERIHLLNRVETNHLISNSEINSIEKDCLLKETGWHDFYWFSNGFLSLDWYRFYQYANYVEQSWSPTNHFSSYNRIFGNRDHRLIISNHLYHNFKNSIILSCHADESLAVADRVPNRHKKQYITSNTFVKTENSSLENLSYTIHLKDFIDSFCHVVTERIYYEDRIHLTEKIFRPIICCRPFILASSPGALSYLKSYGFKTFSDFWSEEYDNIRNHDDRLDSILDIIDYIGSLSMKQIYDLLHEMKDILLFNRKHFYNDFRHIITNELFTNLDQAVNKTNNYVGGYEKIVNSLTDSEISLVKQTIKQVADFDDEIGTEICHQAFKLGTTDPKNIRSLVSENIEYFKFYYDCVNHHKLQKRQ